MRLNLLMVKLHTPWRWPSRDTTVISNTLVTLLVALTTGPSQVSPQGTHHTHLHAKSLPAPAAPPEISCAPSKRPANPMTGLDSRNPPSGPPGGLPALALPEKLGLRDCTVTCQGHPLSFHFRHVHFVLKFESTLAR